MIGRMPRRIWSSIRLTAFLILLLLGLAEPAAARISDLCVAASQKAAAQSGVPFAVLLAITQTETGRREQEEVRPWPWTLNVGGQGHWLDSRAAALEMAQARLATGDTLFDVGCFQINYRWHGQHFGSLDQMLHPDVGAAYAAQLLKSLYQETGDWSTAAGAYHSRTPVHAARYRDRFDQFHAVAEVGTRAAVRANAFPLLRTGVGRTAMGSLVPMFEGNGK